MHCPKCTSVSFTKKGFMDGKQRYGCRDCGCHFTRSTPKGYGSEKRMLAVLLYVHGLSMNAAAKLLRVSHQTAYRWIREAAEQCPMPSIDRSRTTEVEIDEMCLYLKKRAVESGCGRCTVVELDPSSPGRSVLVMRAH